MCCHRAVGKCDRMFCQLQHCTQIYDTVTITSGINVEQRKAKDTSVQTQELYIIKPQMFLVYYSSTNYDERLSNLRR